MNSLNKNPNEADASDCTNQNEAEKQPSPEDEHFTPQLLSSDFKIINLDEAISIIENIKKNELNFNDLKKGIPTKFLEIILSSPVFYNTTLLPNIKYNYQSQFKRSMFSDTEKMFVIF